MHQSCRKVLPTTSDATSDADSGLPLHTFRKWQKQQKHKNRRKQQKQQKDTIQQ